MGGSAACRGEQGSVASPLRRVSAESTVPAAAQPRPQVLSSLLVRRNYSPCNSWAVFVILKNLEQIPKQWSGPLKTLLPQLSWSKAVESHISRLAWVVLAFSKSIWVVSTQQHPDLPKYCACLPNTAGAPVFKMLNHPQVLLPFFEI